MHSSTASQRSRIGRKRRHSSSDHEEDEDSDEIFRPQRSRQDKVHPDNEFLRLRKEKRESFIKDAEEVEPQKLIELAKRKNSDSERYVKALEQLVQDPPTADQVARLNAAKFRGPHYLGRTVSRTTGWKFETHSRKTNGHTDQHILMPAADTHSNQAVHPELAAIAQGDAVYMLGQHLVWHDIPSDEFLSYSVDTLFLVYHALGRHHKGQQDVTIQFLDRRRVVDMDKRPAGFYHALDLYNIFEVPKWTGWGSRLDGDLLPRKFTQEYLTHGTVLVQDERFKQAKLEDLIKDGLYEIFPPFKVDDDRIRAGLYTGQVILRSLGYPPPVKAGDNRMYAYDDCATEVAFTNKLLLTVRRVTFNFMSTPRTCEPHLHIFLSFLTFQKRPKRDDVFIEWIKSHYSAGDVTDLYSDDLAGVVPGFSRVANNLPGVMQYLDLVRDAAYAFGLPELPANEVETLNELNGREFAREDDRRNRSTQLSFPFDRDELLDRRGKAKQKRNGKGGKGAEEGGLEGVESVEEGADPDGEEEVVGGFDWGLDEEEEEVQLRKAIAASQEKEKTRKKHRKATKQGEVGKQRSAREDGHRNDEGAVRGFDWGLNEDEEEMQLQMAMAASLEPGLLGAAGDATSSPAREYEASAQREELDDDFREALERYERAAGL